MTKYISIIIFSLILISKNSYGHPMPYTIISLDIKQDYIESEIKLPLVELQMIMPFDVTNNTDNLIQIHKKELIDYLKSHFKPKSLNGELWNVNFEEMYIDSSQQEMTGVYKELVVKTKAIPPKNSSVRNFILEYTGIMHQLITHKTMVLINQDFDNGIIGHNSTNIAYIGVNLTDNSITPVEIKLENGNKWKGFKSMVSLGMEHISEGTDHLLFLFVLLLSAPLIVSDNKWISADNSKYALTNVFKIVTAFTIGHSITLLIAALGWVTLPSKPIEILIAISILLTALHTIRPVFPNKEMIIAIVFGLIHGLAFATVISNLNLDSSRMIISILGFNIGIELMQLFVVFMVFPWILIMSYTPYYQIIRIVLAVMASIAAIAWIIERVTESPNFVSLWVGQTPAYGKYILLFLVIFTLLIYTISNKKAKRIKS